MAAEHKRGSVLAWVVGAVLLALLLSESAGWRGTLALLAAGLGWLLWRVQVLEQRLHELQRPGAAPRPAVTEPQPQRQPIQPAAAAMPAEPPGPAEAAAAPSAATSAPAAAQAQADLWARRTPPPAAPAVDSWLDDRLQDVVAWLRGGNPLAKVGIVVLFFGAAFLAKYAAERSVFPIGLRFAAIAAVAIALIGIGWWQRSRRPAFAQVLQGGGIAGLYLTVFAATRLYALLPQGTALLLLIGIAVAGALLAVRQSALALAVTGFAGGFLAPVLVSSGQGNHVALFTYYTVLNLGIFAVAWARAWRLLNLVGFVFTFGITALWRVSSYGPEDRLSADAFLLLFFALYLVISLLYAWRQEPRLRGYVSGTLVFGLPVVAFGLHASLVEPLPSILSWSAVGFGGVYAALALGIRWRRAAGFELLGEAYAALAVVFFTLAIPLAFDAQATSASWALEGAGLVWLGARQRRLLARWFGSALQLASAAAFLLQLGGGDDARAFLNADFGGAVLIALAGFVSASTLWRLRATLPGFDETLAAALLLWGWGWWLTAGLWELVDKLPQLAFGYGLAFVALSAVALRLLGSWLSAWWLGLLSTAAAALSGLLLASDQHPFIDLGGLGWPLLLAGGCLQLRFAEGRQPAAPGLLHAAGLWLALLLAAWETSWQLDRRLPELWSWLPWGLLPALLLPLLARIGPSAVWPFGARREAYRLHAAAPLLPLLALWMLAVSTHGDGHPQVLWYTPLFNPLDLVVIAALAACTDYWSKLDAAERARLWPLPPQALAAAAALVVLVWLTAVLVRGLHHLAHTPIDRHGLLHSFVVQAAISIFWSVLGLAAIVWAARRSQRDLWLAGAGLMAVVVAKLFLLDLSGTGSLPRIVSFIGVGAVLLLAGFLAPLPPRRGESTA